MFVLRDSLEATSTTSRVDVAFTDSSLDLHARHPRVEEEVARLESTLRVPFARLDQVHGNSVHLVERAPTPGHVPTADGQVTSLRGVGLMVRVADCVPVVLADPAAGVIGVAHAGRQGVALGVVTRTVEQMRELGASALTGWIGPHVCGRCYEVPEQMRADVSALVPETHATTSRGTPSLDLGAGVRVQLDRAGVEIREAGLCTLEDERLHSHRRDGLDSGRMAGLVWMP